MPTRETTLPKEILEHARSQITNGVEYTDQQLDDTAFWACAGPVFAAATAGFAEGSERGVYMTAGIFAGSIMPPYINEGLLDPIVISEWVNDLPEKMAEATADQERFELGG